MPNKMTDNKIIKALKEILEIMCAMGDLQKTSTISNAIDLINRQKDKIEFLEEKLDNLEYEFDLMREEKQAVESRAVKECIEKVKEYIDTYEHLACEECECVPISKDVLDNLLKEMGVENDE